MQSDSWGVATEDNDKAVEYSCVEVERYFDESNTLHESRTKISRHG